MRRGVNSIDSPDTRTVKGTLWIANIRSLFKGERREPPMICDSSEGCLPLQRLAMTHFTSLVPVSLFVSRRQGAKCIYTLYLIREYATEKTKIDTNRCSDPTAFPVRRAKASLLTLFAAIIRASHVLMIHHERQHLTHYSLSGTSASAHRLYVRGAAALPSAIYGHHLSFNLTRPSNTSCIFLNLSRNTPSSTLQDTVCRFPTLGRPFRRR